MYIHKKSDLLNRINDLKDQLTHYGASEADTDQIFYAVQDADHSDDWFLDVEKAMDENHLSTSDEVRKNASLKAHRASHSYGLHGANHYWNLSIKARNSGLDFVSVKPFRSVAKTTYTAMTGALNSLARILSRELVGVKD